jgi:hypothetical protein
VRRPRRRQGGRGWHTFGTRTSSAPKPRHGTLDGVAGAGMASLIRTSPAGCLAFAASEGCVAFPPDRPAAKACEGKTIVAGCV